MRSRIWRELLKAQLSELESI